MPTHERSEWSEYFASIPDAIAAIAFRRGLQSIKGIPRTRYLVNQWECNNC